MPMDKAKKIIVKTRDANSEEKKGYQEKNSQVMPFENLEADSDMDA